LGFKEKERREKPDEEKQEEKSKNAAGKRMIDVFDYLSANSWI